MIILGIDTSCDDTSAAVVENETVLSNVISSQDEIHKAWGGVVPNLAKKAHAENIDAVVALALKRAKKTPKDIDVIAVTYGPGLAVALEVGVAKAKELSLKWKIPLVAVNHMEGHIYANFARPLRKKPAIEKTIEFPLLVLLASGGHTELVLMEKHLQYKILGQTLDDAAGEAFDKVARMLDLGYPGGGVLAQLAKHGTPTTFPFPLPLRGKKNYDFSYSGIKTAAFRMIAELKKTSPVLSKQQIEDFSASFQYIAVKHLVKRTVQAAQDFQVKSVLVGGGVAANILLRSWLRKELKPLRITLHFPFSKKLCRDNAAMIAVAGYAKASQGKYADSEKLDRDPVVTLMDEMEKQ